MLAAVILPYTSCSFRLPFYQRNFGPKFYSYQKFANLFTTHVFKAFNTQINLLYKSDEVIYKNRQEPCFWIITLTRMQLAFVYVLKRTQNNATWQSQDGVNYGYRRVAVSEWPWLSLGRGGSSRCKHQLEDWKFRGFRGFSQSTPANAATVRPNASTVRHNVAAVRQNVAVVRQNALKVRHSTLITSLYIL